MTVHLEDIIKAADRLRDVAIETPILQSAVLNERLNAQVYIKPECLQHIGAFKFRGAYNRLCQLSVEERSRGAVAFSSGNHAQGIAYAAKLLGMSATIVMPSDAPTIKKQGTERLGASIRLYDRATQSREEIAAEIAVASGATLVPAFDDVDVIAGQGSCGLEIVQQLAAQDCVPDAVLCPCGGGGLLAGLSTAIKESNSAIKVYGVEPEHYDDHFLSKAAGHRVKINPSQATSCDALMATQPGEITWSINSKTVDDFLRVSEDEIAHAISFAFRYLKLIVEPGGAVALAALLHGKLNIDGGSAAIVLSGGNIDSESLAKCLQKHPSP
ncbi:MAG: threonine/serine dehydratase [Pseudohongiellaceae bacterium]